MARMNETQAATFSRGVFLPVGSGNYRPYSSNWISSQLVRPASMYTRSR